MREYEDLVLIQDILHEKPDMYEKIIEKYNRRLYGYIYKLVHDEHIAGELTHDAFVKAYKNLDRFNQSKSFSIWLFTIGRNTVMDHFRYVKRHDTCELLEETDSISEVSIAQNPEHIMERKEIIKLIDDTIQFLPKKYRDLIMLKYFEDLSYEEMAARLNMSCNEVKWRLHQARKKMLQSIEKKQQQESRCGIYGV